jgi:hypothetical protein
MLGTQQSRPRRGRVPASAGNRRLEPGERVETHGFEHVHRAVAAKRRMVFFSGYIANWEIAALAASLRPRSDEPVPLPRGRAWHRSVWCRQRQRASTGWGRTITGSAPGHRSCSTGAGPGVDEGSSRFAPRLRSFPIPMPTAPSPGPTATPSLPTSPGDPSSLERGRQGFSAGRRIFRRRAQRVGFQVSLCGLAGILAGGIAGRDAQLGLQCAR